jgi:thioredoxin-dependent peroxiredoxin
MLKVGDKAPLFFLQDENNNTINLENFIGKPIILFFYPKDNSFLCTKQCISFSKHQKEFNKYQVTLLGISADSSDSHLKFKNANKLSTILLSDKGNKIRRLYKVPNILLNTIPGRVTYIIDSKGYIVKSINESLNIQRHITECLNYLKSLTL